MRHLIVVFLAFCCLGTPSFSQEIRLLQTNETIETVIDENSTGMIPAAFDVSYQIITKETDATPNVNSAVTTVESDLSEFLKTVAAEEQPNVEIGSVGDTLVGTFHKAYSLQ
jgi:hypothetical protein